MAKVPPLRIWLYSAAFAVLVIALLTLYRYLPGDRRDNTIAAQSKTFLEKPVPQDQLRVLGLGSSLFLAATPQPMDVQQRALPGIAWLRLTKGGAGMGPLQMALEAIEHAPPDVLVIEENLLLPDTGNVFMDQLREDVWHLGKKAISALSVGRLGAPVAAYWERNDQDGEFSCATILTRTPLEQLQRHLDVLQKMYLRASFDEQLMTTLLKLSRHGVRIVLLDLPRAPVIEQHTMAQKQRWLKHLKNILTPGDNIRYLAFPPPSQPALYCDLGHLNAHGARLFAPWWQEQLQQLRLER